MSDADIIRQALTRAGVDLEAIDPFQVAAILQPLFPAYSEAELAHKVAEAAIDGGCRLFIWEPPGGERQA